MAQLAKFTKQREVTRGANKGRYLKQRFHKRGHSTTTLPTLASISPTTGTAAGSRPDRHVDRHQLRVRHHQMSDQRPLHRVGWHRPINDRHQRHHGNRRLPPTGGRRGLRIPRPQRREILDDRAHPHRHMSKCHVCNKRLPEEGSDECFHCRVCLGRLHLRRGWWLHPRTTGTTKTIAEKRADVLGDRVLGEDVDTASNFGW